MSKPKNMTPEQKAAFLKKRRGYLSTPEAKAKQKEYCARPDVIARRREYSAKPEAKARRREYIAIHRARPEVIDSRREYAVKYQSRPDVKAKRQARASKPEARSQQNARFAQKYATLEGKAKYRDYKQRSIKLLDDYYIADLLSIPARVIKNHPELLESKREQIKILRELKPQTRKQIQCTRVQAHCNKSETTFPKPLTRHGSTSLLSLELSSWSTPWVRQLTLLLLKSKPLR